MTPAAANATATSPFAWLLRELLPAPDAAQLGLLDQELPETEGGASSSVLFEPLTDLGFSFKSYEVQSNARAVMVTLSLNNIFAFPVRVHTGAYPIACVLGAGGARDDASPAAARATVGAQDASVMPRNAWHVAVLVEVEDAEQIGRDLISPALVGVPVSVRLRVAGNAPRPSAGMQLAQWALQRVFPDGAWLRPGSTPPVAAAVNMLDSLDLSFSGADLGLKMTLVVPIPGIKLYVPWEVPRITLTLAPPGGAGADAPDPSTDVVATFAVSPGFLYTTAELDVTIKDVDNRCSPLLSAIAFNVAAALPGSLRVGDELVPFPITLRLRPGLFLNSSLLGPADGRSTFEGPVVMSVQEGDGFCGVSAANGSTLGIHGHVCNRQAPASAAFCVCASRACASGHDSLPDSLNQTQTRTLAVAYTAPRLIVGFTGVCACARGQPTRHLNPKP